jgi:hypothetical protein
MHLAQDRDQWWTLMNAMISFLGYLSDCWLLKKGSAPWSQSVSYSLYETTSQFLTTLLHYDSY